ncbi:MAG: hypothetical protein QGI24_00645 [Kiritimatiellia bacterium]|jgi:TolA-binding protein|nr:hypothetical protein [Kiritimatiellia bacterium]MDP6847268.1 hypothetical protein [Kiritimatiellia bacterium]
MGAKVFVIAGLSLVVTLQIATSAPDARTEAFGALCAKIQKDAGATSDAEIIKAIDEGRDLGKPYVASLAVKRYLSTRLKPSLPVLKKAIDNAVLVGDFQTVSARCKMYLQSAQPGQEASDVAAALYAAQIDFLDDKDDTYRFMTAEAGKFRHGINARKFDAWYLDEAVRRSDVPGAAKRLAIVFGGNLPIEEERTHFWSKLDWLIAEVGRPVPSKYPAASDCVKLSTLIRGDERRKAKCAFYAANLKFKAGAAGKEKEVLDKEFQPVIAAANTYLGKSLTAETLKDVLFVFADGDPNRGWRENQVALKQAFFVSAFDRINDADREELMAWNYRGYIATAEQWIALGAKHAALFRRASGTRSIPLVTSSQDPAIFKKQAAFLQGVSSQSAAQINSLAASTDFNACLDHLIQKESWHLPVASYHGAFNGIWGVYSSFPRDEQHKLPNDYRDKAWARMDSQHVSKTPLAFHHDIAREVLQYRWRILEDKSQFKTALAAYDWVPYAARERKGVFSGAYDEFKGWAEKIRRESGPTRQNAKNARAELQKDNKKLSDISVKLAAVPADKPDDKKPLAEAKKKQEEVIAARNKEIQDLDAKIKKLDADMAVVTSLEAEFKRAQALTGDPNRAPNPLCRQWGLMVTAERSGNAGQFVQAARGLYQLVKDVERNRTPFGREAIARLFRPATVKGKPIDVIDFQCEVMADQLTRWNPNGPNERIVEMAGWIVTLKNNWGWGRIPKQDKAHAVKINAVFEKAVLAKLGQGNWRQLFEWMMNTRTGQGWKDYDLNKALLTRIVKEKRLPAVTLMAYLKNGDFGKELAEQFPVASYFDDSFVQEATASGYMDYLYRHRGGTDEKSKIRNLAAKTLQGMSVLPLGYSTAKVKYTATALSEWHSSAMGTEEAVRNATLTKIESYYGKTRFDEIAMGAWSFSYRLKADTPETRKEFFVALSAYLDRAAKAPVRLPMPHLGVLNQIPADQKLTDEEISVLMKMFTPACRPADWQGGHYYDLVARRLQNELMEKGREKDLYALVPHFWRIVRPHGTDGLKSISDFSEKVLTDEKYELATVYSTTGLDYMGASLDGAIKNKLTVVRSKSITEVGGAIPVDRSDPRYALFAAQADYFNGSVQRAWQSYLGKKSYFSQTIAELDTAFVTWVINMHSQASEFNEAENYCRSLMKLMDDDASRFSAETRALVILTYADIAFHRLEYPRAKALYGKIVAAKEFEGTRAQIDAHLRMAEVDRLTGQFDEAIKRVEELLRNKTRYVQMEGFYHLALIRFDMEEPLEAHLLLNKVFAMNPSHANARILEGRVNLILKDYEKASEIRHVGISLERDVIVPGKPLRMSLLDQNLSVVGRSTAIEIRVWTDSGDEEILILTPFADSKTRFEGELFTALAPTEKGDKVLQLLGNDKVRYDFTDGFKKSHKVSDTVKHTLSVVSDSAMYTSSGKILSSEEYETRALEERIRQRMKDAQPKTEVALSARRPANQIKPGNKINVRVVDPDRSTTAGRDKLAVRVATSSGDKIPSFMLVETDTHSGIFEGAIPTESAPATAYATDSMEGREPNFVISSGNYPAWVALADNERPKEFSIDLNEFAGLGTMKLDASEVGRQLKDFAILASPNGQDFHMIGSWPLTFEAWDGSPTAVVMERVEDQKNRAPASAEGLPNVAAINSMIDNASWRDKRQVKSESMSASWDAKLLGVGDELKIGNNDMYVLRYSAGFYLSKRQVRTLKLNSKGEGYKIVLTVDGKIGTTTDEEGRNVPSPLEFTDALKKGVHRVDVYVEAARHMKVEFALQCDIDDKGTIGACPADMFDPDSHVEIREALYLAPAGITPNEDATSFNITFGEGTRARVLKIVMSDFETDAPAINKITLKSNEGKALLPTLSDLMALRQNERLEIVPGDKIGISYEDPKYVDKDNKVHETFLSATYANAKVSAVFVKTEEESTRYVPLRRFTAGDAVATLINDPDMDVSEKLDVVNFTVRTARGTPKQLQALETDKHTGVFVGRFFPVEEAPQRASEIMVEEDDEVTITYFDAENIDPGVGWERTATIEQAHYQTPELRIYDVASRELTEEELGGKRAGEMTTRTLTAMRPEEQTGEDVVTSMLGGSILVELLWPTIARSPESEATVFVQTSTGRAARGAEIAKPFDVGVPGTLEVIKAISGAAGMKVPPGYDRCLVIGDKFAGSALDDGRFMFSLPVELSEEDTLDTVTVKSDDNVFVGFQYIDDKGATNWITREVKLASDGFFNVMDRDYENVAEGRYVGESVYFRVINLKKDVSDERDTVQVKLACGDAEKSVELRETFTHSGVFKGMINFSYATGKPGDLDDPGAMPVTYGSTVKTSYDPGEGGKVINHEVGIFKGSDGDIMPFTKRFKDPEMAVRTRLTVAEAYFELAKKHRRMKQEELAEKEIAEGKRLMEESLKDFPETEMKAQADYLLANLVLELAEETDDPKEKQKHYNAAVVQFSTIVSTYNTSGYAPKAQFKKALALEKMGDIDRASDEYVKLSYRWPDNELVPETIARLGQYFFAKGKEQRALAKVDTDAVKQEVHSIKSRDEFTTAAEVFRSLAVRFPTHALAEKTTALSAQCFMRAEDYDNAITTFKVIVDNADANNELKAESMYWCGDCYTRKKGGSSMVEAYRMFKGLTWDYPASKWAKFARGRLADETMVKIDEAEDTEIGGRPEEE